MKRNLEFSNDLIIYHIWNMCKDRYLGIHQNDNTFNRNCCKWKKKWINIKYKVMALFWFDISLKHAISQHISITLNLYIHCNITKYRFNCNCTNFSMFNYNLDHIIPCTFVCVYCLNYYLIFLELCSRDIVDILERATSFLEFQVWIAVWMAISRSQITKIITLQSYDHQRRWFNSPSFNLLTLLLYSLLYLDILFWS